MDLDRSANDLLDLVSLVIRSLSGDRDLSLTAVATLGSLMRAGPERITTFGLPSISVASNTSPSGRPISFSGNMSRNASIATCRNGSAAIA